MTPTSISIRHSTFDVIKSLIDCSYFEYDIASDKYAFKGKKYGSNMVSIILDIIEMRSLPLFIIGEPIHHIPTIAEKRDEEHQQRFLESCNKSARFLWKTIYAQKSKSIIYTDSDSIMYTL